MTATDPAKPKRFFAPRGRGNSRTEGLSFAIGIVLGCAIGVGIVLLPDWQASLIFWGLAGAIALRLSMVIPPVPGVYGLVAGAGVAALGTLVVENAGGPEPGCIQELVGAEVTCGDLAVAPWLIVGIGLIILAFAAFLADRTRSRTPEARERRSARRSVAVPALAGGLVVAVAGLVVALVATNDQPEAFPAPWEVAERGLSEDELAAGELDPERRRFAIRIDPGHCWDEARSPVRGVEVDEQRRRVVVTALTERAINELDCLSVHPARVTLDEPLGDRRLVVGGNDPTPAEIPMRPPRQDADRKEDGS